MIIAQKGIYQFLLLSFVQLLLALTEYLKKLSKQYN